MSDWLDQKAEEERARRLYGKEPGKITHIQAAGGFIRWLVAGIIRWTLGLLVIAILVALCLWGLIVVGNDKYILDCPGVVETRDRSFIRDDSLHLDVTEFGGITRLWADDDGNAMSALAGGLFYFLKIKRIGSTLSLTGAGSVSGHYTPLTRIVELKIAEGEWFKGQCTERASRK